MSGVYRFNLILGEKDQAMLTRIKERSQSPSNAHVIRQALNLLTLLEDAKGNGEIVLRNKITGQEKIVLIP